MSKLLQMMMAGFCLAVAAFVTPALAIERQYQCDDLAARSQLTTLGIRVYQGDSGWFFRYSDLNTFYMLSPYTMRFLGRLRDVLATRGTTLVLMPVPPRSVLEPAHSAAASADDQVLFDPDFAAEQFQGIVDALKADGLAVADVLGTIRKSTSPMDGDYFFARDIHWRPKLAKASADAVADLLVQLDGDAIKGEKNFVTRKVATALNESNTNSVLNQLCAVPLPGETLDIYTTEQADQSADAFLAGDDAPPPVNVIGTSFTDETKPYNFSGFLREDMQNDVATYSILGGGVDTSLYKWAYDGLAQTSGAKALVWELPYAERLENAAGSLERVILPAIAGDCAATPNALVSVPYTLGANGEFKLPLDAAIKASGDQYYVAATLSDTSLPAFTLRFQYRDGREDILPLVRPERVAASQSLFGEVSGDVDTELASITLVNRNGQPVNGTISFCQYPAGTWRTTEASQGKATP